MSRAEMLQHISQRALMNTYRQIALVVKLWPHHDRERSVPFGSPTLPNGPVKSCWHPTVHILGYLGGLTRCPKLGQSFVATPTGLRPVAGILCYTVLVDELIRASRNPVGVVPASDRLLSG